MRKLIFVLIILMIAIASFLAYWFWIRVPEKEVDIISELKTLQLEDVYVTIVNSTGCKKLTKSENLWTIGGCNNDVYFKIFLEDGGYTFGKCTTWNTPREAFLKLSNILPIKECKNVTAEDKFVGDMDILKMYNVCGLKILFRDECIVGVG